MPKKLPPLFVDKKGSLRSARWSNFGEIQVVKPCEIQVVKLREIGVVKLREILHYDTEMLYGVLLDSSLVWNRGDI